MFSQLAQTYTYSYTTTTTTHHYGWLIGVGIFVLIFWIISIVALWKVFVKAGRPGWAAIIPIYDSWVLFEISGKPGWWALIGLIPYLGGVILLVLYILAMLELAKRFGKSPTFAVVGLIIFSLVGLIILGFGDAKYSGDGDTPVAASPAPKAPTPPTVTPPAPTPPQAPAS